MVGHFEDWSAISNHQRLCTCVHVYIHNAKESLALNLEIGKTNWHSTVIADIRDSALSSVVSQMADPTQFWSAIFMFCSENGRWQAAISSSVTVFTFTTNMVGDPNSC